MEMANILSRKKIQQNKAKRAIDQTLDIAASHAMEGSRRERYFENRAEAKKGLDRLIKHLDRIEQALSKLTPSSQAKLNKIMAEREWRNFDTEIFAELIQAMMDAKLSPARVADEARSAMSDASLKSFNDPVVYSIPRTAPPAILDLWEIIPAETRTKIEQNVRKRLPRSALKFFRDLAIGLRKHYPQVRRVRRVPMARLFGYRVAPVWYGLGLHVGRAYRGEREHEMEHHVESDFQKFCRLALAAAGDDSRLSGRQIDALKSQLRRNQNCYRRTKSLR